MSAAEPVRATPGVLALAPLAPGAEAAPSPGPPAEAATLAGQAVGNDGWALTFGATEVGDGPTAVAVAGATVYVGGSFTGVMAGMPQGPYNRVARWDGEAWHRMGKGVDGPVAALTVAGTDVYVGGTFDTAGVLEWTKEPDPGFAAQHLAVWRFEAEGVPWTTPGGADRPVQALATPDGRRLVVGGHFRAIGPITAGGVAELEPAQGTWSTYGTGIGGGLRGVTHVEALGVDGDGAMWVGGTFNTAGDAPSCSVARYTP